MYKTIITRVVWLVAIVALTFLFGCSPEKEEKEEQETEFLVTSPLRADTLITNEYVCQIHSIRNIELRALEKGYLESIYVDEGQSVRKGQLMFKILPTLYEAELQKVEAEARVAEIEYLNTKVLADSNIVSPNELAMAKAKYEKVQAELALAQVHLGFTQIRAPFSGIMDRLHVREGSLVEEGELLTTLSDNSKMWVYFNVPEAEYLDYQSNAHRNQQQQVSLQMANGKIFQHEGVVGTIEGEFNHETGNIAFRATFPNPEGLLRHGETGNILMTIPVKDALLIPQKTTFEVLEKRYVFVVTEEGVIESREVAIAEELPHIYAISDGLEEGDKILLEGLRLVKEGDKIQYQFEEPEKVLGHLNLYVE